MLTQSRLKEVLDYDAETGEFRWKHRPSARQEWNTRYAGKKAGTQYNCGWRTDYIGLRIDGIRYSAHQMAWLYVNGSTQPDGMYLDHINGDGTDNRISNLRLVTPKESNRNLPKPKRNKSGVAGVHYDKSREKWMAHIRHELSFKNIGRFDDYFEAVCARKSAELAFGYHPNHGR